MASIPVTQYNYDEILNASANLIPSENIGARMAKGFTDSALGIVQNIVEAGADIHDTVMPKGYESLLNPAGRLLGEAKASVGYNPGIDYAGMTQGLKEQGLAGFWDKFKAEDIPELIATSAPYMAAAAGPVGFGAIATATAKDIAKNTATNEGRNPNDTTLYDTLQAAPAALAITALDSLIPNTMTANVAKTIAGRAATTAAARTTGSGIANVIKGIATSVVTEGATESVQELIQYAQEHKGQGVFEADALSQYGVAGLLGGISGGSMDVALKPIDTIGSVFASGTDVSTPPSQSTLDSSKLSGIVSSPDFASKPEVEKQEFIDTNFGRVDISNGIGSLKIMDENKNEFNIDFNFNPIPDEQGNVSYATMTDKAGTKIDLKPESKLVSDVYNVLHAKLESFDSIESLTDYVNSTGITTSPLLDAKLLTEIAEVNRVRLEALKNEETLGSAEDSLNSGIISDKIKSIHSNLSKEMNSLDENGLWNSIGRMVFDHDTLEYIDLPSRKKADWLQEITGYEQKIRLYKYLQRFPDTNKERVDKIFSFMKKEYGLDGLNNNGIVSFKEDISEPVVDVVDSPSPENTIFSAATGSDIDSNPVTKSFTVKYNDKDITVNSIPRDNTKPLGKYKKDGTVELQEGLTSKDVADYLEQSIADNTDAKQQEVVKVKQEVTKKINDTYGIDLVKMMRGLTDQQARKFIINHELRHSEQVSKRSSHEEFMKDYKADPVKFEYDAQVYALKKLVKSLKENKLPKENEVKDNSINVASFFDSEVESRQENMRSKAINAKTIADRLNVDFKEQTINLVNEVTSLKDTLKWLVPSSKDIQNTISKFKYYVAPTGESYADKFEINSTERKDNFYETTSLLSAISSLTMNTPMFIDQFDDDTSMYLNIMNQEDINTINEFGGLRLDDIVNSIGRSITREFGIKPEDKFDDNAHAEVSKLGIEAGIITLQALLSQGKIKELVVKDQEGFLHRFYKLTEKNEYDNISSYVSEFSSHSIVTPNNDVYTDSKERNNVDKTQIRSNGVKVSKVISDAILALQNQSYEVNKDMQDILFDEELMNDKEFIDNITEQEDPSKVHPNFKKNIESKNASYKRTLDRIIDYVKANAGDKFWYKYQVNGNGRFQPYATVLNPVSDKLFARWMVDNTHEDSSYMVRKGSDKKTTYNWKHAIVFAMAEAKILDVKADKIDGKSTMEAFDSLANDKTIIKAIEFMSSGNKNKAIKLMSKGGLHSIRAFMDYYKYSQLKDGGIFKTNMPTEVDGTTNGLFMALMQFGNGAKGLTEKFLNMVGAFYKNGDYKSMYEYRRKGGEDLYTTISNTASDILSKSIASEFFTAAEAMGRSVAKSPVMVWLYNAGDLGIKLKVGNTILESFMNKVITNRDVFTPDVVNSLKEYYKGEYLNNESISKVDDSVAKFKTTPSNFNAIVEKILNGKALLTEKEMFNIEQAFGDTVGNLIVNEMETQFGYIQSIKNVYANASHVVNQYFHKKFTQLGRKAYKDIPVLPGYKNDSGVAIHSYDKQIDPNKKYSVWYKQGQDKRLFSNMAVSPEEKIVQNPLDSKGNRVGQKKGYVLNVHNQDSTTIAKSITDTVKETGFFGFPIFDAYVGPAGSIDTFMDKYNNNGYDIHKEYNSLESMRDLLEDIKSKANELELDDINKALFEVNEYIKTTNMFKADRFSEQGLDRSLIQQMTGIQPYENYLEEKDSLGSSTDKNMGEFVETRVLDKDTNDFVDLYDEIAENDLVEVSSEHDSYLKELVGYYTEFMGEYQKQTKVNIFKGDVNKGKYYKEELSLSLSDIADTGMSGREVYAHELTHKLTRDAYEHDVKARNEMNEEFRKFKEYVASNPVNINAKTLSYILSRKDAHEFIAFIATNEEVSNATKLIKYNVDKNLSLFNKIQLFIKTYVSSFIRLFRANSKDIGLVLHENMNDRATSIIHELLTVNKVMKSDKKHSIYDTLFEGTQKINKPIASVLNTAINKIKSSSVGNSLSDSFNSYGKAYRVANNHYVRILSNEILERPEAEENQLKLSAYATNVQANYISVGNAIASKVNKLLSNASTEVRTYLKETIVDLDLPSVMSSEEIAKYLTSAPEVNREISSLESQLLSFAKTAKQKNTARFMINQARGLGYYIATNDSYLNKAQLLNANNISDFRFIKHSSNVEKLDINKDILVRLIDKLSSLHGILHTDATVKSTAGNYIKNNLDNVDKINEYILSEANTSKQQLFNNKGEGHLYIKGYSTTMLDRNYSYTIVPVSQRGEYLKNHWEVMSEINPTDRTFAPNQVRSVLMRRVDVDPGYEPGILSIQSPTSKGRVLDATGIVSQEQDLSLNVDSYIGKLYKSTDLESGQMIPLLSPNTLDGVKVVNYRYSMSKNNKKSYLGMISDISTVLSETKAMTDRKIREEEQNQKIVKTLTDDFFNHKDTTEFVEIGHNTEYSNQWNMLPRNTRNYIKHHLGTDSIYIRKNMIDEYFGYKNLNINSILKLKKDYYPLQLLEKIFKDAIKIARSNLAVRSVSTLLNNTISNLRILASEMPLNNVFKYVSEGWLATDAYRADHMRLLEIEQMIASKKPYNVHEYKRLKEAMKKNPVSALFEAGKFEAIIDDISVDKHEVNNIIERYVDRGLGKVPSRLRNMLNVIYFREGTTIFNALLKFMMYSDFVARYALYKNAIEQGTSKEEALSDGDKYFVRYSVIQDKKLKYLSDTGIFIFSKYLLRIQKGIARLIRKNPASALQQGLTEHLIGDTSDITDSGLWNVSLGKFNGGIENIASIADPHLFNELGIL